MQYATNLEENHYNKVETCEMKAKNRKMRVIFPLTVVLLFVFFPLTCQVWTYDCPGGEEYISPDYEVSVIQGNDTLESFVYYSFGKDTIVRYDWQLDTADLWVGHHQGPERHSSSIFSFADSVTVRVKIKSGAQNITLPLMSAKILPSSYNIPCEIKDGNTIEFKLDRPEKVVVFPNYDQAWDEYVQKAIGHVPLSSWRVDYSVEKEKDSYHGNALPDYLREGYQNPLFIFAHGPEKRVPNPDSPNTLVVNPGDFYNQNSLFLFDTIWFKPGIHDFSFKGTKPWYQTKIKKGQTFYLEGGCYLKGRFKEDNSGSGPSAIIGRGIISGIDQPWVRSFPEGSQVISIDSLIGITITDRACFGIYGGSYIGDVAMIGAWHGNTDGPDYTDNCLIENCFLQAHDDNLKINHNTHARHIVIWQGTNAHPIMVKETFRDVQQGVHLFANSIVEDVDIVGYFPGTDWDHPWPQLSRAAISVITAMDIEIRNFTFRDIRIEAPYLTRILNVYNLNTNLVNPGWFQTTSESYHTKIDGITFSDISVKTPLICYESLLGSGYLNSTNNIQIENFTINGTELTDENIEEYFEIECDMIENLTVNDSLIVKECVIDTTHQVIHVYGVTIGDCPTTILETGDIHQLLANVAPPDADDTSVTWTSSNPLVAGIDENGMVKAISQGTSTITIRTSDGGFTSTCKVGIMSTGIAVSGVSIQGCTGENLFIDSTFQLLATVEPSNAGDHRVTWSTSNSDVLQVDELGVVEAISPGDATITATTIDGGFTDHCTMTVTGANEIKLSPAAKMLDVYPNPVTDMLHVRFREPGPERQVRIYNLYGQLLFNENTHKEQLGIDISVFDAGSILILHVRSKEICESFKLAVN